MKNMINNFYRHLILFVTFFSFVAIGNMYGQSNTIVSGKVTEDGTGNPLPGATVYIENTTLGATTNLNGEYTLLKVPSGKQTLIVSFIGYENDSIEIVAEQDQKIIHDFILNAGTYGISEIVITVQARGQLGAINQQRSSDQMKNVVSAEKIQEVPDANAAESVSRLPGIAISRSGGEGSKVVIRGLSPEYSKITLNGVSVPSTSSGSFDDAGSRSTDISMISSESLSGIEVFKSLTPDMDGDAIAGTVNLQIAKAKKTPKRYVRLYNMYNVDANDFKQYRGVAHWSQRILNEKIGIQASVNAESRNRSSDGLEASYELSAPIPGELTPLKLVTASVTDVEEYRKRLGGNLIIDYNIGSFDFMLSNMYNSTQRDIRNRTLRYQAADPGPASYISNPERNIDMLTNTLNVKFTKELFKVDMNLSRTQVNSNVLHDNNLNFAQPLVNLPEGANFEEMSPTELINSIRHDSTPGTYDLHHNTSEMQETNYMADMNITVPFKLGDFVNGDLKFGGKYRASNRENSSAFYIWRPRYEETINTNISEFFDSQYDPGNFLDGASHIGIVLDPAKTNEYFDKSVGNSSIVLNDWSFKGYHTKDHIIAGYVMTKLNIGKKVIFIPGVRYENFIGDYTGENRVGIAIDDGERTPSQARIVHTDWLPMFNLKVTPNDWFDIRMSVTKTLIRPGFNQMLPNLSVNIQSLNRPVNQGNPELEPTRSWNYDTYLTFYNKFIGFFTIGGFYKDMNGVVVPMTRFIETSEKADSLGLPETFAVYRGDSLKYPNRQLNWYENGGKSKVYGIELDWQTNLRFLPSPFNGIVVGFNYSLLWSSTTYPNFKSESVFTPPSTWVTTYKNTEREGRVIGQADQLMNFSFGYDIKGFSARVSMTYQGESLRSVGSQVEHDRWNQAYMRWDVSVKQQVGKYLTFFLNGANLNNQSDETTTIDGRASYLHYYGPTYDFGMQVKF